MLKIQNGIETAELVMTMGLPGSGKTTKAKELFGSYSFIDPDTFKASHPDYDSKNPSALHAWSAEQAEKAFEKALIEKGKWVVDGTGVNAETMVRKIKSAKAVGFNVTLMYVKVSLETALARNKARERTVPEEIINSKARDIGTSYEIISQYVDEILIHESK